MSCTGQKLSALTFAPDLALTDLFYMAEDIGGGIFLERKVELSQLDSRWVNTSGDAMTGALSMGGFQITDLGAPVNPDDATTKSYVDSLVGAGAPPFTDSTALVKGSVTPSKLLRFEVDGFTAATTRVLTPQNSDYTIAGLETANIFTANQDINGLISFNTDGSAALAGGAVVIASDGQVDIGLGAVVLFPDGAVNFATAAASIDAFGSYTGPLMDVEVKLTVQAPAGTEALVRFNLFNPDVGPGIDMFQILGSGTVLAIDGTGSNPAYSFISDPSSGMYLNAATVLGFSTDGSDRLTLSNTDATFFTNILPGSLGLDIGSVGMQWQNLWLSGNINFPDDIRQTFNPGATVAGYNFGSVAADPSTPINGDSWYQSTANELRFRINGATVSFPTATTPLAVTRGGTGTATAFTQGSIIFAGPGGVYAEDNANWFWDDTGNQVFLGGATAAAADTLLGANGSAIFNEQGSSVDFRVESDTKTHMLFVQGSTNRIGINTSAPTQMFELWGTQNTANRYLLFDDTNWIRFQFQSSHATIGTIWNLTSGKDWYFGEAADLGTYFFRGRNFDISPAVSTTGAPANFKFTGAAHTGLTASTEVIDAHFSLSRSVQHATGALATQRAFVITNPTYSFVGASTITNAATFAILGAPVAGTNATLTNTYSLWVQAGTSRFDGNISMGAARTLSFVSGTDQRAGNAVLVAGTVTVNNTTVTANTIVMLTRKTAGGTVGTLITYTVAAGTSFTINSDSALDTSTFSYMLIEVP